MTDTQRRALAIARHPTSPTCPGCTRPIVPGTAHVPGKPPRHLGCPPR